MKKIFFVVARLFATAALAQDESKLDFSVGADFVSSYVWRGMFLAGTSIQPEMDFTVGGFSVGAWGSVGIANTGTDGIKEVNLIVSHSFGNLSAGFTNYWFSSQGDYNYFDFSEDANHSLEANLLYSFGSFPLSLGWNTIIAGNNHYLDDKANTKRAFSTYVDATYDFLVKDVELGFNVGISPWKSGVFYTDDLQNGKAEGFAMVNLSLAASKNIKISENYSLGIFGQLLLNPAKEDAFFVFGVRF